jgi:DNA-binding response OmpR family regulator
MMVAKVSPAGMISMYMPDEALLHVPAPLRDGYLLLVSADRPWLASATAFLIVLARSLSTAETAVEAIDIAMSNPPDVAVIAPPIGNGSPVLLVDRLAALRDRAPFGIVYVADHDRELTLHAALMRAGANECFSRGVPIGEAAARVVGVLREIRAAGLADTVTRGPLTVDFVARTALVNGVPLALTDGEFSILCVLARAVGRVMTQGEVAAAIGARRGSKTSRSIPARVESLRAKLGAAEFLLQTSRRDGFRLRFAPPW